MKRQTRLWASFAIGTYALLTVAALVWILDHPLGTSWDESMYFNQVLSDTARVKSASGAAGNLTTLGGVFLKTDRFRPPAFRLLAFPVAYAFGFSPTIVRLVSFIFLGATLALTYLTVRRVASASSAALSVVILALCPGMIFESMTFGTEYPLFFATSGMLYFLFSNWNTGNDTKSACVGLGLSLGLGALSKATFLLIGGPALLAALIFSMSRKISSPTTRSLMISGLIGLAIALPWWALNTVPAMESAASARAFVRHSLGSPSVATWGRWIVLFAQNGLGLPLSIVSLAILFGWIAKSASGPKENIPSTQRTVLLTCFLCPLPVLVAHLAGQNQNLMHVTPVLPFLAVGLAVLADTIKWDKISHFGTAIAALLAIQLIMTLFPLINRSIFPTDPTFSSGRPPWLVMARTDQWDWSNLRSFCQLNGIDHPSIAFLGSARSFNPPSIAYPWVLGREILPDVRWLWRYEEGTIVPGQGCSCRRPE